MLTLLNKILLVESHCVSRNLNWDALSAGSNPLHSGIKCATATKNESDPNFGFCSRQQFSSRSLALSYFASSSLV